ncbi:Gfo/Idh/MocA family protein [Actinoplanes subglobosus]|uniref:Gfo/Idh/MocA family protein n=1 Tax=Actinoplanes subglobosus TaxID=1547892 RepID=A0ABV8IV79_9ACTN
MTVDTPSVLLIGLGLHARRIHFPLLTGLAARGRIAFRGVVDRRAAERDVREFLTESPGPPLTLVADLGPAGRLEPETESALDALVRREGITAVLVATEPLAHHRYAEWALSRGLHVLVDKPPTAHEGLVGDPARSTAMVADLLGLAETAGAARRHAAVLTQRRYHRGFRYMRALIEEVREMTGCPPTSVAIEHTDGEWRMPWEVLDQDYHPFHRGYGVLLHSGYHAVDTALWLTGVTGPGHADYQGATVQAHFTTLDDVRVALPDDRIRELLGSAPAPARAEAGSSLGEIDARLTVGLHRDGATPTVLSIAALHTSFSRRGWLDSAGRNLYVGNGRKTHETVSVQQGPFQTLRLHSYKAHVEGEQCAEDEVGGGRHWRLQVFRNASVFPDWKPVREFTLGELPADALSDRARRWLTGSGPAAADSIGTEAKQALIIDFLRAAAAGPRVPGDRLGSELGEHVVTVSIIGAAYESWASRGTLGPPAIAVKWPPVTSVGSGDKPDRRLP